MQLEKKGKLPYLIDNCDDFLPKTIENQKLKDEVQKCRQCKYKKAIKRLKGLL